MAVDDEEAPRAVASETFEDAAEDPRHRVEPHVDRAGKRRVVRRDAEGHDGRGENVAALFHFVDDPFGDEPVGAERSHGAVLFGAAHGDDDERVGVLQNRFGLVPGEMSKLHDAPQRGKAARGGFPKD